MPTTTRRKFLATAAASAAASTLYSTVGSAAVGANERVRIGVIGAGNQGKAHHLSLSTLPDVKIAYVCDIDEKRLKEGVARTGAKPESDLRRVLDDPTIDGVTIATPDHWHVPAALLALDAGKHVYVEKPCSYNFAEGQMLVKALAKSDRVFAHGTQARSCAGMQQAINMLRDGIIGDVLIAKCWNWQRRNDIGHQQPSEVPAGVDYDTWVGPAEWIPFQANRFHYDWHWWFNFGSGGMGNDGVHELDYAMWGLGVENHPSTVSSVGGIYYFKDDREWADTMQVSLEYPGDPTKLLIYEQRLWSTSYPFNVDAGAEYFGTKGRMFLSKRGKFEAFDDDKKRIDVKLDASVKSEVSDNQRNWVDSIKTGSMPNAPIDAAFRTAAAIHLGNISTRLGRTIKFDPKSEKIVGDEEATAMLSRKYRKEGHWSVPKMA
ncbi:Gfo/Idh/MocA family protein [Bythopirellula polymerisocia]|uniref:Putative oxidoreductase YdgJ n=1 Tax=Bythopirellula polymerisocia TaxID=2528003 RepID=A0A5C6CSM1_9BACT|nr:Gfo/Idh/MocA family oxidoreductase [Bythopirellula polymerisocia]TWU27512.1 putative oxidoreductase YdgJ [Bythopirellula polymerisocia]